MLAAWLGAATVAYTIVAVSVLTFALLMAPSTIQAMGPTRILEGMVPGGLTAIGLVWGGAFALASLIALMRGAPRITLVVTLAAFSFTAIFLEVWIRAAALQTQGSVSAGDLWLYFGSRLFFLGAGVLVVAAAAIRWPRAS